MAERCGPFVVLAGWPGPLLAVPPPHAVFATPYYSMGFVEGMAVPLGLLTLAVGLVAYRRRPLRRRVRAVAVLLVGVVLAWEVLWNADIVYLSWLADRHCEAESGLHVYRTVRTDGFLGDSSIDYWSDYGFAYVEKLKPRGDGGAPVVRYVMEDGELTWQRHTTLRSRYEYSGLAMQRAGYQLERRREQVRERETGEVLGELVSFAIYPGQFDRLVLALLPGAWQPWTCGDRAPAGAGTYSPAHGMRLYSPKHLIKATLKPLSHGGDTS